jgi:FtsZ-interacting cell division protein ZipA
MGELNGKHLRSPSSKSSTRIPWVWIISILLIVFVGLLVYRFWGSHKEGATAPKPQAAASASAASAPKPNRRLSTEPNMGKSGTKTNPVIEPPTPPQDPIVTATNNPPQPPAQPASSAPAAQPKASAQVKPSVPATQPPAAAKAPDSKPPSCPASCYADESGNNKKGATSKAPPTARSAASRPTPSRKGSPDHFYAWIPPEASIGNRKRCYVDRPVERAPARCSSIVVVKKLPNEQMSSWIRRATGS